LGIVGALKFSIYCLPLVLAILYLGHLERKVTLIYVERFDGHMARARALRRELDKLAASGSIQTILSNNPLVKSERIRDFWNRIGCAITVLGVLCLVGNICAVGARAQKQSGPWAQRLVEQLMITQSMGTAKPTGPFAIWHDESLAKYALLSSAPNVKG
jgi:hypothetical protein